MRSEGLITTIDPNAFTPSENHQSPWQLRTEGLDRALTNQEWAAVIHHLIKYRGFHSSRKSELNDDEEVGQMLSGLSANQSLLVEGPYRSPAELAVRHDKFSLNKRNKSGSYTHTFSRKSLGEEMASLFAAQRRYGNPHASKTFEEKVFKLFWSQRPPLTGKAMLQLLGRCTFERDEYRAPKRSHSAERFVWLSKLNNLYLVDDGDRRILTDAERQLLLALPFSGKTEKITYKTIRTCLKKHLCFSDSTRFAGLSYRGDALAKNPEDATIFMSTGWQTIRRAYEKADLNQSWDELISDKDRLNQLGYVLSVLKTDEEIKSHLSAQGFSEEEIVVLLPISFKDFISG